MATSELIEALRELIPDDENAAYCVVSADLLATAISRLDELDAEIERQKARATDISKRAEDQFKKI